MKVQCTVMDPGMHFYNITNNIQYIVFILFYYIKSSIETAHGRSIIKICDGNWMGIDYIELKHHNLLPKKKTSHHRVICTEETSKI